ncbi:hypothetical protein F511_27331 [Dorcoceras hygrometricum]|uniref:Dystroglycan-like n=1 Tax=Dorcoceras hygrometricum TaxID=472368 RepID=A0A2Z7BJS1_9LAMI|nr:hypothetical protein F511_27331 [Dorcoceras hygrometricum]
MASSYYTNTLHVSFESVLAMDNPGMVSMFKALTASGLQGFLGCPAVIYEAALIDLFENALVRDGVVISTVAGKLVEISEELFAETFELPVEGLNNLSEIPKDLVFDAKSIISLTGEPVSMSGKKKEMKIEFLILCDIMAKTISIKAGSFDAITQEKFPMIAGIICGVQVNWNKILFNILKDMVTAETRQARGYAIQISLLLENISNLELGESTEFPSSKILIEKTVHRYIILNERVGGEDVTDAPRVKRTPVKRAVSKKRPAAVDTEAEPIVKKRRTTKSKVVSSKDTLDTLPVEAVPLQMIAPTTAALTEQLPSTRSVLGKCVYLVTLAMSLFDLKDVCIAIGSIVTLDLPMVVDLIGIYGLKGPYCTLTMTDWFLQALSVIPRGSWGDVARRFTMIRWAAPPTPPTVRRRQQRRNLVGPSFSKNSSVLLVQPDEGVSVLVVDRIGDYLPQSTEKSRVLVIPVGARHKCRQDTARLTKVTVNRYHSGKTTVAANSYVSG